VATFEKKTMEKVTYYVGAGASFNSIPIQNELCKKMKAIGLDLIGNTNINYKTKESAIEKQFPDSTWKSIGHDLIYFADRGIEFGTIDTYARKLSLLKKEHSLNRLKSAINTFFCIWQSLNDYMRNAYNHSKSPNEYTLSNIDNRYHSLFSNILEWDDINGIKIQDDVNFISWNYDLQLELAFSAFANIDESMMIDTTTKIVERNQNTN
jgi:hypothetical protein